MSSSPESEPTVPTLATSPESGSVVSTGEVQPPLSLPEKAAAASLARESKAVSSASARLKERSPRKRSVACLACRQLKKACVGSPCAHCVSKGQPYACIRQRAPARNQSVSSSLAVGTVRLSLLSRFLQAEVPSIGLRLLLFSEALPAASPLIREFVEEIMCAFASRGSNEQLSIQCREVMLKTSVSAANFVEPCTVQAFALLSLFFLPENKPQSANFARICSSLTQQLGGALSLGSCFLRVESEPDFAFNFNATGSQRLNEVLSGQTVLPPDEELSLILCVIKSSLHSLAPELRPLLLGNVCNYGARLDSLSTLTPCTEPDDVSRLNQFIALCEHSDAVLLREFYLPDSASLWAARTNFQALKAMLQLLVGDAPAAVATLGEFASMHLPTSPARLQLLAGQIIPDLCFITSIALTNRGQMLPLAHCIEALRIVAVVLPDAVVALECANQGLPLGGVSGFPVQAISPNLHGSLLWDQSSPSPSPSVAGALWENVSPLSPESQGRWSPFTLSWVAGLSVPPPLPGAQKAQGGQQLELVCPTKPHQQMFRQLSGPVSAYATSNPVDYGQPSVVSCPAQTTGKSTQLWESVALEPGLSGTKTVPHSPSTWAAGWPPANSTGSTVPHQPSDSGTVSPVVFQQHGPQYSAYQHRKPPPSPSSTTCSGPPSPAPLWTIPSGHLLQQPLPQQQLGQGQLPGHPQTKPPAPRIQQIVPVTVPNIDVNMMSTSPRSARSAGTPPVSRRPPPHTLSPTSSGLHQDLASLTCNMIEPKNEEMLSDCDPSPLEAGQATLIKQDPRSPDSTERDAPFFMSEWESTPGGSNACNWGSDEFLFEILS